MMNKKHEVTGAVFGYMRNTAPWAEFADALV